jgi:hypothetical protein
MTRARDLANIGPGVQTGFRNAIINGAFKIDQRNAGASQTFTAAAALAYSVDRWYGYCTGANVTGARVAGTAPNQYYYRFTGAASNTAVGFGQRIESTSSSHFAGQTASLSVSLASTSITSLTWTAYYANTADTFGSLASPTRTQIATGTFTINSTLTRYSTNISVPAAATTGIEIVFTSGALLATQTLTFSDVQFELGTAATPFEYRPIGMELALCQRYYERYQPISLSSNFGNTFAAGLWTSSTAAECIWIFKVLKRVPVSITFGPFSHFRCLQANVNWYAPSAGTHSEASEYGSRISFTTSSGGSTGQASLITIASTSGWIAADAEL